MPPTAPPSLAPPSKRAIRVSTSENLDAIAIRTMAYFALTFDHRLVDGADADRFMAHVKDTLQDFDENDL
mgnify:CR=1 FL=1